MKLIVILLAVLVISIGITSATQVTISPTNITVNTFPGETHTVLLNITSDGDYTIYFKLSNPTGGNPDINISPSYIDVIDGVQNVLVNLTFPYNISSGTFSFDIESNVTEETNPPSTTTTPYYGGGSGESGYYYWGVENGTNNSTINNSQNNNNNGNITNEINSTQNGLNNLKNKLTNIYLWFGLFAFVIIAFIVIMIIYNNKKAKWENENNRKEIKKGEKK